VDAGAWERPPDNLAAAAKELIRGVYKLNGRLLLVLDAERTAELVEAGGSAAGREGALQ
jgi:chemotaxis signal transduction protein